MPYIVKYIGLTGRVEFTSNVGVAREMLAMLKRDVQGLKRKPLGKKIKISWEEDSSEVIRKE
jgi:hypothetical protein